MPEIKTMMKDAKACGNTAWPYLPGNSDDTIFSVKTQAINGYAKVHEKTGEWIYTPKLSFIGIDSFTLNIREPEKEIMTFPFIMDVQERLPDVIASQDITLTVNTFFNGNVKQVLLEQELNSYQITSQSLNGTVALNPLTGNFTYTPGSGFTGTDAFSITACDKAGTLYTVHFKTLTEPLSDSSPVSCGLPFLDLNLAVHPLRFAVGEIISYTILVKNTGRIDLNRIKIHNFLPSGFQFLPDSLLIDGISKADKDISSGIDIDSLFAVDENKLQFDVQILSKSTSKLSYHSKGSYEYYHTGLNSTAYGTTDSNHVELHICHPHLSLSLTLDKDLAILGDILTYMVTITNDGDVSAVDILLKDSLPDTLHLMEESFSQNNGTIPCFHTRKGFYIPLLPIDHSVKLQYCVKVSSIQGMTCITNKAIAEFEYITEDVGHVSRCCCESQPLTTLIAISAFQRISLEQVFSFPMDRIDQKQIIHMEACWHISSSYKITTAQCISHEGQQESGEKLIVHGQLEISVEYIGSYVHKEMRSALFQLPFSTFIVLPEQYQKEKRYNVKIIIQSLSHKMLTGRDFFLHCFLVVYVN